MKGLISLLTLGMAITCGAVPQQINYQGYLTSPDGTPLDTTVAMTFALYYEGNDIPIGTETHSAVTVTDGIFHVLLGSIAPLADSLFSGHRYLGVTIGSDDETLPRLLVATVPHAFRVGTIDGASGGTIDGSVNILGRGNIGTGNLNSGACAFVAGCENTASGDYAVAVGMQNSATGPWSTIAGGGYHEALGHAATVAGGESNHVSGNWATVSGGIGNEATNDFATVSGGANNHAHGAHSCIAGGSGNHVIGTGTFVCGNNVDMVGDSSFIFGDGTYSGQSGAGGPRRFIVIASGGSVVYSSSDISSGVRLNSGANSWSSVSDSTRKRNIRGLDTQDILSRFSSLPLKRWEYQSEDQGVEHLGPMAQDFWNAFHLGSDSLGIETIDADGVALAAIQELYKEVIALRARVQELETHNQLGIKEEK